MRNRIFPELPLDLRMCLEHSNNINVRYEEGVLIEYEKE